MHSLPDGSATEPVRPSALQRDAGRLGKHGEGGRLTHRIYDEIDTITLKCLQKDRERRYQTAGELGRDVHHYLNGEPIEAKRDALAYVIRKQLSRYKLPATLASMNNLALLYSAQGRTDDARPRRLRSRPRAFRSGL